MKVVLRCTCFVLMAFGFAQSSDLPVEKCTLTDKACMRASVQKMIPIFTAGMPEHGVAVMDPLAMGLMKYDLSGLQFSLTGGIWKGLKDAVVNDVDWDTNKKIFTIDFNSDAFIEGKYTAAGVVMDRPISGDGQMKLKFKTLNVKLFVHFDMDKDHVKPTKYTFEFDVKDNASFDLSNLYGGDKEKSDAMLALLNENWKAISAGFGQPMVDTAAKEWYKNMENFFKNLPITKIANV